jgi:hypothetical protein
MYKTTLACVGIDPLVGEAAAKDIEREFRDHRNWHRDVKCRFNDGELVLIGTNDVDKAGLALLDEFGDCLSAYLTEHGAVRIVSVEAT